MGLGDIGALVQPWNLELLGMVDDTAALSSFILRFLNTPISSPIRLSGGRSDTLLGG